jgi:hypothetical protein
LNISKSFFFYTDELIISIRKRVSAKHVVLCDLHQDNTVYLAKNCQLVTKYEGFGIFIDENGHLGIVHYTPNFKVCIHTNTSRYREKVCWANMPRKYKVKSGNPFYEDANRRLLVETSYGSDIDMIFYVEVVLPCDLNPSLNFKVNYLMDRASAQTNIAIDHHGMLFLVEFYKTKPIRIFRPVPRAY